MRNRPSWKNRPPGIITKMVNFDGTLVGKPNPLPANGLRSVCDHANHAKRRGPTPPKRSVYFVNPPPDFFHPHSPHMSLSRPKHGFPHSRT